MFAIVDLGEFLEKYCIWKTSDISESVQFLQDGGERKRMDGKPDGMIYTVDEVPPWYLCIPLGLQVRHSQQ